MENVKLYSLKEIKNYLLSQESLGDIHYNLSDENIKIANIEKICSNCAEQYGEECGITGSETYDDSTCDQFTPDI